MDNNLIRLFLDAARLGSFSAAGSVRGVVKISAPSDLGRNVLMPMLDDFRKRHPDVQYALTLSGNASNMVQDDPDLVLRYGQLAGSGMVTRVLAPSRRVVCACSAGSKAMTAKSCASGPLPARATPTIRCYIFRTTCAAAGWRRCWTNTSLTANH